MIQPQTREEAIELNKTVMPTNKETFKKALEQEKTDIEDATLQKIYETFEKWLIHYDTNLIDLSLAAYISIDSPDTPLFLINLGQSGIGKNAIAKALWNVPRVIPLDQITPNTLASGMKNAHDLGETLQNSSHSIVVPDMACFSQLKTDDKKTIWAQFRTLHDGTITKNTGNDINKKYEGCHVSFIGYATPSFKNEQIIKDQLGTRELMYTIKDGDKNENLQKVRKALTQRNQKTQMDQEIKETILNLLKHKKFNPNITTPPHIQEYIEKKVFELSIFRAVAQIDYYSGELFGSVDQEVPTRVAQQLDLLYRSLHSLDNNYPDTKYHEIVENIVNTSSAPLRKEIYEYMTKLQKQADKDQHKFPIRKNINELSKHFNKSRKTIKIQCLILVELGIFNVEYEIETLGRSFEQEIAYFYLKERQTTIDDGGDIN